MIHKWYYRKLDMVLAFDDETKTLQLGGGPVVKAEDLSQGKPDDWRIWRVRDYYFKRGQFCIGCLESESSAFDPTVQETIGHYPG